MLRLPSSGSKTTAKPSPSPPPELSRTASSSSSEASARTDGNASSAAFIISFCIHWTQGQSICQWHSVCTARGGLLKYERRQEVLLLLFNNSFVDACNQTTSLAACASRFGDRLTATTSSFFGLSRALLCSPASAAMPAPEVRIALLLTCM